jgi:hydroxymethylglutaryl-CoA reductase
MPRTPNVDSRIPGFYRLPLGERRAELSARLGLSEEDLRTLDQGGLDSATADQLVENALGIYGLPLGLGLNFRINGRDYLVPMAVEEPSVIAAASNAARIVRGAGGFEAEADAPVMTAQVELVGVADPAASAARIRAHEDEILALACLAIPRLVTRGGGARGIEVRVWDGDASSPGLRAVERRLVVHVHVDCRDAMGANLVNTVAEAIAPRLAELGGGRFGLRILTNLCDRRLVRARARVPFEALGQPGVQGAGIAEDIAAASRFAERDLYRAATHNKGIMNGVDAVVIASGNDWRGVEAGAHAYASRSGRYQPLAVWSTDGAALCGSLEMPMAVGTVGGTLQVHGGARLAQRILGVESASDLAMVAACVGLASNLAALRALATEGIQRGHMALHNRAVGRNGAGAPVAAVEVPADGEAPAEVQARQVPAREVQG